MKDIRKKDKVGRVLVSSVNENTLAAKLLALGITAEEATPRSMLEAYMEWNTEQIKDFASRGEDYAECDPGCKAPCHPSWSACPVCGAGDTELVEEVIEVEAEVLPKDDNNPRAIMRVADLDDAVVRIKTFQADAMRGYYKLGRELASVFSSGLYKLRLDDQGNILYNSWNEFCEAEIGLGGAHCRNIANVTEKFTEEQCETLGVEKLRVIMRADPKDYEKLLADAPMKTVKELQKVVIPSTKPTDGLLGKKLKMNEERLGTEAAKALRISKQLKETGKEITVANQLVTRDILLSPKDGNGFQGEETSVNGVETRYQVFTEGKNRILRISYKRPDEDA